MPLEERLPERTAADFRVGDRVTLLPSSRYYHAGFRAGRVLQVGRGLLLLVKFDGPVLRRARLAPSELER